MPTSDIDKEIGARVRTYRLRADMSQERVGHELGLTFQQIQKYEKGTNRISVGTMLKLCKLFEITPHELIGYQGSGAKNGELFDNPESIKLARLWNEMPKGMIYPEFAALIKTIVANVKRGNRRAAT